MGSKERRRTAQDDRAARELRELRDALMEWAADANSPSGRALSETMLRARRHEREYRPYRRRQGALHALEQLFRDADGVGRFLARELSTGRPPKPERDKVRAAVPKGLPRNEWLRVTAKVSRALEVPVKYVRDVTREPQHRRAREK